MMLHDRKGTNCCRPTSSCSRSLFLMFAASFSLVACSSPDCSKYVFAPKCRGVWAKRAAMAALADDLSDGRWNSADVDDKADDSSFVPLAAGSRPMQHNSDLEAGASLQADVNRSYELLNALHLLPDDVTSTSVSGQSSDRKLPSPWEDDVESKMAAVGKPRDDLAMPALQRTTPVSNSTAWLFDITTEAFNDTDFDDDNSTAATWPDSCPNSDDADSRCHDAWPMWIEVAVPIFCIGAFIAALLVIYFKPSKATTPKRRTTSEVASEMELQGLRSVNVLTRNCVGRRSDASSVDAESERSRSPLDDSSSRSAASCQKTNCPLKSNGNCPPPHQQLLENIPEHLAVDSTNSTRI